MTKKDFEAIARAIAEARTLGVHMNTSEARANARASALNDATVLIADYCAADNPRFDRARFMRACGVEGE